MNWNVMIMNDTKSVSTEEKSLENDFAVTVLSFPNERLMN